MGCAGCGGNELEVVRGETLVFGVRMETGTDWTGATALFTAKRTLDDDPNDTGAITGSATGVGDLFTFEVPTTADTGLGAWRWDVKIYAPGGGSPLIVPSPPGHLTVLQPVTNRTAP